MRPYQEMAIFETLYRFSQNEKRILLLMATGTGKTFTVFQLGLTATPREIESNRRLTDEENRRDTFKEISRNKLRSFRIPVPSIVKQQ